LHSIVVNTDELYSQFSPRFYLLCANQPLNEKLTDIHIIKDLIKRKVRIDELDLAFSVNQSSDDFNAEW